MEKREKIIYQRNLFLSEPRGQIFSPNLEKKLVRNLLINGIRNKMGIKVNKTLIHIGKNAKRLNPQIRA